jgi:hypothetical protein
VVGEAFVGSGSGSSRDAPMLEAVEFAEQVCGGELLLSASR